MPLAGPPPGQHVPTITYNRFPGRRETRTAGRQWLARTRGFIRIASAFLVGYLLLTVWHCGGGAGVGSGGGEGCRCTAGVVALAAAFFAAAATRRAF